MTTNGKSGTFPFQNLIQKCAAVQRSKRLWLWCLAAALVPVVLLCLFATPYYGTVDDYSNTLYANGAYSDSPGFLMQYTYVFVSAPLCALYRVLPAVPWYPLYLLLTVAVSFAILYAVSARLPICGRLRAIFFALLILSEIITILYLTYTIVAFLSTAAGLSLLFFRCGFQKPGKFALPEVAAFLAALNGLCLRMESAISVLAIFFPFFIWVLVKNRNRRTILRLASLLVALFVATGVGRAAYDHADGWEGWNAYLDTGRAVVDHPPVDYETIRAAKIDLSENDINLLYRWTFADKGTFTLEKFSQISSAQPLSDRYSLQNARSSGNKKLLTVLLGSLVLLFLLFAAATSLPRGKKILMLCVVALSCLSFGYLLLRGRVVLHAVLPLWMATVSACFVCCAGQAQIALRGRLRKALLPAFAFLFCAAGCISFGVMNQKRCAEFAEQNAKVVQPVLSYYAAHEEAPVSTPSFLNSLYAGNIFAPCDTPKNAIRLGGGMPYTGPYRDFCEKNGLDADSLLRQLATKDKFTAILNPETAAMVQVYLEEHLHKPIEMTVLDTVGDSGLSAYQYRAQS